MNKHFDSVKTRNGIPCREFLVPLDAAFFFKESERPSSTNARDFFTRDFDILTILKYLKNNE